MTLATLDRETLEARILGRLDGTRSGPVLLCVGGMHGNEPTGVIALKRVLQTIEDESYELGGTFVALVGNLTAQFGQLSGCHVMGVDRLSLRLELAAKTGIERCASATSADLAEEARSFTDGFGMDFGVIAFGGEATDAFKQIADSLKTAPDTHRMGRIVIVGGAQISHGFAAALGNVDVRSAARTGPGYHDEAYEHGVDYPSVFVEWPTRRNLSECLRAVAASRLSVEPLITHRFGLDEIGEAVDVLVETPDRALGVVLSP